MVAACFAVLTVLLVHLSEASVYSVSANRLSLKPLFQHGINSIFNYSYNAALFVDTDGRPSMLVRCQNATAAQPYAVGPSWLAISTITDLNSFQVTPIQAADIVFQPAVPAEKCGTEDPRVAFNPISGLYELFYTAYDCSGVQLSIATTATPHDAASYKRMGPILATQAPRSKSGAALLRKDGTSYLYWGDTNITIAKSNNGINWTDISTFITTRSNNFDSNLVEAGPPPVLLSDGNYLFIYNSARAGYPSIKPGWNLQYNIGFVILNGTNPTQILQRAEKPIFSPVLDWEVGNATSPVSLTPNVVFCEGLIPLPDAVDKFLFVYGAADTTVGIGVIHVTSS